MIVPALFFLYLRQLARDRGLHLHHLGHGPSPPRRGPLAGGPALVAGHRGGSGRCLPSTHRAGSGGLLRPLRAAGRGPARAGPAAECPSRCARSRWDVARGHGDRCALSTLPCRSWSIATSPSSQAVGTSAACGLPIALAGAIGFAVAGWARSGCRPGAAATSTGPPWRPSWPGALSSPPRRAPRPSPADRDPAPGIRGGGRARRSADVGATVGPLRCGRTRALPGRGFLRHRVEYPILGRSSMLPVNPGGG